MENNSKTYALVAWTDKGRVLLTPGLLDEEILRDLDETCRLSLAFRQELERRDAAGRRCRGYARREIDARIALSRSYERLAGSYLSAARIRDAWWALGKGAAVCADASDALWVQGENGSHPAFPLLRRFYEMHGQALRLARRYPSLRKLYRGSGLERDYLEFSLDQRLLMEEIREADAWRTGMQHEASRNRQRNSFCANSVR